ncbi:MAG: YfcE family phosphodiesterase [Erysipelotrichaceae bacterium]|nr:YfcE family phosphodiesterase [Erysipelotrichaceae bacterium]MDD3923763.1 YfcE family phosphodiesterase [Erysipelotrichaceae bacterium]MDD4642530.1 YfcE family phosphodiesterase [Erysipelotrichaceae bacterium]
MERLIVVSDNHGYIQPLLDIRETNQDAKAFLHCGDSELRPELLNGFVSVRGNNDLFHDYPEHLIIKIANMNVLLVHGHRFASNKRIEQMTLMAKKNDCQIVCYGHTHVFAYEIKNGVHLINPGSVWRARDGKRPSYVKIDIIKQDVIVTKIEL